MAETALAAERVEVFILACMIRSTYRALAACELWRTIARRANLATRVGEEGVLRVGGAMSPYGVEDDHQHTPKGRISQISEVKGPKSEQEGSIVRYSP